MGYFPETVAAGLRGDVVRASALVWFQFTTQPMRLWFGYGPLDSGGAIWSGVGELGSISGLESAIGGTAPQATFSLSGVDPEAVAVALNTPTEVKGRDVTVYVQFFTADAQPLDNPYAIYLGVMDQMRVRAEGPSQRTIEVTAETLFARRAMPPWGYLTDRDQQRLHPGDRGLELVPRMVNKSVQWPIF